MEYIINFSNVSDKESLYSYLKTIFNNDSFYGNNLDALIEVLISLRKCNIILKDVKVLKQNLGDYASKVINTFKLASQENEKINVIFEEG
jgi:RNAse (barnase) inhibitor barstar